MVPAVLEPLEDLRPDRCIVDFGQARDRLGVLWKQWNVVGPTTSSVLTICSRKPATMEAIAMTVAIPITTPSTVSAERSLLARSWSRAMRQPSRTEWSGAGPAIYSWRSASIGSSREARCAG
ncbi:MAG: hypothetical protein AUH41_02155 [Gemmatimonadetes bacterium 13_1_40CM_66_11]|nr:MAG: hypothetical protein AUH41_02155 [Gemmatimonadetes bacterium 13_1_40CM_66_11]